MGAGDEDDADAAGSSPGYPFGNFLLLGLGDVSDTEVKRSKVEVTYGNLGHSTQHT
jgi:hypothetical protein